MGTPRGGSAEPRGSRNAGPAWAASPSRCRAMSRVRKPVGGAPTGHAPVSDGPCVATGVTEPEAWFRKGRERRPDARLEDLEREVRLCAAAHRLAGPGGHPLAPGVGGIDREGVVALFEGLSHWTDLHELFRRDDPREPEIVGLLGKTLAVLHREVPPAEELPEAASPFLVEELSPASIATLTGESLELIRDLQASPALGRSFDALDARAHAWTFIHGDLKLDNVLVRDGAVELRLVDWELGGLGDPAWDVGSATGDLLYRWLGSARPAAGSPPATWLEHATIGRARVTRLIARFLEGYEEEAEVAIDRAAVGAYVGLFLLHRAQAWIDRYGAYSLHSRLLAHVGRRLCLEPERTWRAIAGEGFSP